MQRAQGAPLPSDVRAVPGGGRSGVGWLCASRCLAERRQLVLGASCGQAGDGEERTQGRAEACS